MYLVLELPNLVLRTIGQHICHSLVNPAGGPGPREEHFVDAHMARQVAQGARLASWDLKECF